MKKILPLLLFIFSGATAQPLTKLIKVYENNESFCSALGKDNLGNLFGAGRCGKNTIAGVLDTIKFEGMYITKMTSTGTQIWRMNNIKGPDVTPRAVYADNANNIFVVGNFFDSLVVGTTIYTTSPSTSRKFFVAKYKSNGAFAWVKVAATNESVANGVTLKNNQLFLTGSFLTSFNYQGTVLTSTGNNDIWVLKLDTAGTVLAFTKFGGTGDDAAEAIDIDASNNIFICGYYSGTFNFGTSSITSHGNSDCYLAKLNSALTTTWVKTAGSTGRDVMRALAVDGSGNIYTGGNAKLNLQFDPAGTVLSIPLTSGFIAKYNSAGALQNSRVAVRSGNCIQMDMVGSNLVWCGKTRANGPLYYDQSISINFGHADDGYYVILDSTLNAKSIGLYSQLTGAEQRCFSLCAIDNQNFLIGGFSGRNTKMPDTTYYHISAPNYDDNIYGGFSFIQKITVPHLTVTSSANPILPPVYSVANPLTFTLSFGANTLSSSSSLTRVGYPYSSANNYLLASTSNYNAPSVVVNTMADPPNSISTSTLNFYFQNKNLMVQCDNAQTFCQAVSQSNEIVAACSSDSVTMTAFPGCTNYLWYASPATLIGSGDSITIAVDSSVTYYVTADSLGLCRYKAYVVTTGYSPSVPVIGQTGNVLFSSEVAFAYQWYVDGVAIPGATEYYYTPSGPGVYQVEDFNAAGCSSISDPFVIVSTLDLPDGAAVNLYPNPADESVSVSFVHFSSLEKVKVEVINTFGQVMMSRDVRVSNGNALERFDTAKLPAGFYALNISGEHIQYSQKLFVIH